MNPESAAIIDLIKTGGGADFDIRTYPVGNGMTRVNVQPRRAVDYTPSIFGAVAETIGVMMGMAVVSFIATLAWYVVFGGPNAPICWLAYVPLGLTLLSGVVTICWQGRLFVDNAFSGRLEKWESERVHKSLEETGTFDSKGSARRNAWLKSVGLDEEQPEPATVTAKKSWPA